MFFFRNQRLTVEFLTACIASRPGKCPHRSATTTLARAASTAATQHLALFGNDPGCISGRLWASPDAAWCPGHHRHAEEHLGTNHLLATMGTCRCCTSPCPYPGCTPGHQGQMTTVTATHAVPRSGSYEIMAWCSNPACRVGNQSQAKSIACIS